MLEMAFYWSLFFTQFSDVKRKTVCDLSFVIFMFMWTLRLGIFPSWIIYTTTVEAAHLIQMTPFYYICNSLFSILLVLHIIWFYYIVKIAYKTLATGVTEDSRSDSESADDEFEEDSDKKGI